MPPPDPAARGPHAPYPLATALAVSALCAVDIWAVRAPIDPYFLAYVPLLAAPIGAVVGLGLGVLLRWLPSVRWVGPWLLPLAGLSTGAAVASALGVFARLEGEHARTAAGMLAGCSGGGLGLAFALWLMQARGNGGRSRALSLRRWLRGGLALAMLLTSAALTWADHVFYVRLYPSGHLALRLGAALAGAFGLALLLAQLRRLTRPPHPKRDAAIGWVACALAFTVPVATLDGSQTGTVQALITRPWPALVLKASRRLLDLDRDGFSALLAGGDCDDFDDQVHPAAPEIPGNGIDDNCMFGDARRRELTTEEVPHASLPPSTSVVLVTIDTLRWDRFGLNDPRHRETMPKLMSWARKATNFERAYSPGAWTSIALASLLHGRYPRNLQWEAWYEYDDFRLFRAPAVGGRARVGKVLKMFPIGFRDPRKPLPYWLQRRDMYTAAVVDDGFSQMLARSVGASTGFDIYREISPSHRANNRVVDTATTGMALRTLRRAADKGPFFLWVHYFGPHSPNTKHKDLPLAGPSQEAAYDHEVRHLDRELSRLLSAVDELQSEVSVFVTSDHGEDFGKGYRSHGMDLREALIRVPLLARVRGWPTGNRRELVSLVDLAPTIMSLTDTPAPSSLDGVDLDPVMRGVARMPKRLLFSDNWLYRPTGKPFTDMVAAFDGQHKVVFDRGAHGYTFEDQRDRHARALPMEGDTPGALMRAAQGYVEESGGMLNIDRPNPVPPAPKPKPKPSPGPAAKSTPDGAQEAVPKTH